MLMLCQTTIIHAIVFQLLCMGVNTGQLRKLTGKKIIQNVVLEESFEDTLDCEKDKQVGPRANQAGTISGSKDVDVHTACHKLLWHTSNVQVTDCTVLVHNLTCGSLPVERTL